MIGIVLVAHAHIATETKAAVEHILGPQTAFGVVDIANSDLSDNEQKQYEKLLGSVDNGQGVLVMADLFGATPCNIALATEKVESIAVVAGFNVPAVIKAVTLREEDIDLKALAKESIDAGRQYMQLIPPAEGGEST